MSSGILPGGNSMGLRAKMANVSRAVEARVPFLQLLHVWVGLLKWDYHLVMILGTVEQKKTSKMITNTVVSNGRKMAHDGRKNFLGWASFVCVPRLNRLAQYGMGYRSDGKE